MNRPERYFSVADFEQECERQHLVGTTEVTLKVIFHTEHFLILPKQVDESFFFHFHYPDQKQAVLRSKLLSDGSQKIVYDIEAALEQTAQAMMPKHTLLPDAFLFAEYALKNASKEPMCFVYHDESGMQIFAAQNGKLTFANRFDAATEEEKRYFILGVQHVLGDIDTCLLCTLSTSNDELKNLIEPYFKHLETRTVCENQAKIFTDNIVDDML